MFLRLLKSLYPLLKDILLEGKSLREATKDKRGGLLVLLGVLLSLSLNYILIPRSLALSARIVELEKQLKREIPTTSIPNNENNKKYNSLDFFLNESTNIN